MPGLLLAAGSTVSEGSRNACSGTGQDTLLRPDPTADARASERIAGLCPGGRAGGRPRGAGGGATAVRRAAVPAAVRPGPAAVRPARASAGASAGLARPQDAGHQPSAPAPAPGYGYPQPPTAPPTAS